MPEQEAIKLRIPGTDKKIKLPKWAPFAAAGAAVVAVVLLRGKQTTTEETAAAVPGDLTAPTPETPIIEPTPLPEYAPYPIPEYPPEPSTIPTFTFVAGEGQVQTGILLKTRELPENISTPGYAAVLTPTLAPREPLKIPDSAPSIKPTSAAGAPVAAATPTPSTGALLLEAFRRIWPFFPRNFPHALPFDPEEEERRRRERMEALRTPGALARAAVLFRTGAAAPGPVSGGKPVYSPTPAPSAPKQPSSLKVLSSTKTLTKTLTKGGLK